MHTPSPPSSNVHTPSPPSPRLNIVYIMCHVQDSSLQVPGCDLNRRSSEGDVSRVKSGPVKHKPPFSPLSEPSSPQLTRSSSPTPSTESESSSQTETPGVARRPSPPPCSLQERVREIGLSWSHVCMCVCMYVGHGGDGWWFQDGCGQIHR